MDFQTLMTVEFIVFNLSKYFDFKTIVVLVIVIKIFFPSRNMCIRFMVFDLTVYTESYLHVKHRKKILLWLLIYKY